MPRDTNWIDWTMLADAVRFYVGRGFRYTELPWFVQPATALLMPFPVPPAKREDGRVLSASPELAFVEKDNLGDGDVPEGRFVACGPCFTDKDQTGAMQVVLYQTDAVDEMALAEMAHTALDFHRYHHEPADVALTHSESGYALWISTDLVGSYEIRSHGMLNWICGTGLIEPRFGQRIVRG